MPAEFPAGTVTNWSPGMRLKSAKRGSPRFEPVPSVGSPPMTWFERNPPSPLEMNPEIRMSPVGLPMTLSGIRYSAPVVTAAGSPVGANPLPSPSTPAVFELSMVMRMPLPKMEGSGQTGFVEGLLSPNCVGTVCTKRMGP